MLRLPGFLRRFIRRTTQKQNIHYALVRRRNISIVYALVTWNLMGLLVYSVYKSSDSGNIRNLTGGRYYADLLESENVTLKRYKGFTKVGEWDLQAEKDKYGKILSEEDIAALKDGASDEEIANKYKVSPEMQELEKLYMKKFMPIVPFRGTVMSPHRIHSLKTRNILNGVRWCSNALNASIPPTEVKGNASILHSEVKANASSLYVPSDKRSEICSILEPYLDFDGYFQDVDCLGLELLDRGLGGKFSREELDFLKERWGKLKLLMVERKELEKKMKVKQGQLKSVHKGTDSSEVKKTESDQLKGEIFSLRKTHKEKSILDYEYTVIPTLLDLPNRLDTNTPRNDDEIVVTFSSKPSFDFHPLSHCEMGKLHRNIEFSDVSPGSFYLLRDLAETELAIEDYLVEAFHDLNFIHHSNPDLSKGVTAEGCGLDLNDPFEVLKILYLKESNQANLLYLTGGCSLPAFTSYFAKRIIHNPLKFLPQKLFATGRLYRPLPTDNNVATSGIFASMQSSAFTSFIAFDSQSHSGKVMTDEILNIVTDVYSGLGLHFRVVKVAAKNLHKVESSAYSIEMFSTSKNVPPSNRSTLNDNYVEVGRISITDDYISKRLLMLHSSAGDDRSKLDFLNIIYVKVMDISKFIAVLLENSQTSDQSYQLPTILKQHMLR